MKHTRASIGRRALWLLVLALSSCGAEREPASSGAGTEANDPFGNPDDFEEDEQDEEAQERICALAASYPGSVSRDECSLDIPTDQSSTLVDFSNARVTLTAGGTRDAVIGQVEDASACGEADGWHFDDVETPSQVILCSETCERAVEDPDSQIDIALGCDAECADDDAGCSPL